VRLQIFVNKGWLLTYIRSARGCVRSMLLANSSVYSSTQKTMMWHGIHYSRLSSLLLRRPLSLSHKSLPIDLQTPSTSAFKASLFHTVQPLSEYNGFLFSEGRLTPPMFTPNEGNPSSSEEISNHEWQIRTGQSGTLSHRSPFDSTISLL